MLKSFPRTRKLREKIELLRFYRVEMHKMCKKEGKKPNANTPKMKRKDIFPTRVVPRRVAPNLFRFIEAKRHSDTFVQHVQKHGKHEKKAATHCQTLFTSFREKKRKREREIEKHKLESIDAFSSNRTLSLEQVLALVREPLALSGPTPAAKHAARAGNEV